MVQAIRNISNTKAQFFIAAAVIIIFSITMVFHYIINVPEVESSAIESYDTGPFFYNMRSEFGREVEDTLSKISAAHPSSADAALRGNLSEFANFTRNITNSRGMSFNVTTAGLSATNTSMIATVNFTLTTLSGRSEADFIVTRSISLTNIQPHSFDNPQCNFTFEIHKEYGEPIHGLIQNNIVSLMFNGTSKNGGDCPVMLETSPGRYNLTCNVNAEPCTSVPYYFQVNLTDNRNIRVGVNQTFP